MAPKDRPLTAERVEYAVCFHRFSAAEDQQEFAERAAKQAEDAVKDLETDLDELFVRLSNARKIAADWRAEERRQAVIFAHASGEYDAAAAAYVASGGEIVDDPEKQDDLLRTAFECVNEATRASLLE